MSIPRFAHTHVSRVRGPLNPRPIVRAVTALGISSLLVSAAWSQSLPELYEAARGYDAAYLAAKAQAESTKYKAAQSDALLLPSVNLNAGASQTESNGPRPPSGSNRTDGLSSLQAAVQARQSLFNRSNTVTIEQAKRSLEVASADLETAEQDLIVRVAQAYFDVLGAQDSLTTAQTNKRAIREQLASAKRNFEVGTATITDTREAQARFDLAGAQELAAENDLQTKSIALDVLVGRSNIKPLALATPVVLPAVAPADVNAWVAAADEQHPSVRKARLGLDVAKLETEKARAADGPTVDLTGALQGSRSTGGLVTPLPGNTLSAKVGIELNMPLYSGGLIQNRIKESLALEEKSRNDFDNAKRSVAQLTRVNYFAVNSLLAQVTAFEAAESSSQLALEATQLGYKVGVRVNLDVLNAQTQLFTTRRDLAKARYDVLLTSLRLRQASGQLKADDVNNLNRLFKQ